MFQNIKARSENMFTYENHLGGDLFSSETGLDWDELYCEQCGDSDRFLGEYDDPYTFFQDFKEEYDILFLMDFIEENFDHTEQSKRVFLVCQDKESQKIFVCFSPENYKFGEYQKISSCFCLDEKFEDEIASSLTPWVNEVFDTKRLYKNDQNVLYLATVEKDEYDTDGAASYMNDGWYGYIDIENYNPLPEETWIKEVLSKDIGGS